jgi:hypothetical protein
MEPVGLRDADMPDGSVGKDSHSSVISEEHGSYEEFGRIDWAAAAPSWASIVGGVMLPIVAVAALIFLVDVALCWAFEQWIGHFRTLPFWLLAALAFPIALVGTVALGKLFLQISIVDQTITRSKEIL